MAALGAVCAVGLMPRTRAGADEPWDDPQVVVPEGASGAWVDVECSCDVSGVAGSLGEAALDFAASPDGVTAQVDAVPEAGAVLDVSLHSSVDVSGARVVVSFADADGAIVGERAFSPVNLAASAPDDPSPAPSPSATASASAMPSPSATSSPDATPSPTATPSGDASDVQTMHRLYNPNSGEHFYTASDEEQARLVSSGWNDEGVGWVAPESSGTPVYRLYNANAGDHHYTTSEEEKDGLLAAGWSDEGIGWYSAEDSDGWSFPEAAPLWRQYNPNAVAGAHNYTLSKDENDSLVNAGWRAEGVAWYAVSDSTEVQR